MRIAGRSDCPVVNIGKIGITNCCILVPYVHGIDRLSQLGTARLVNTTGINPCVLNLVQAGWYATLLDLLEPFHALYLGGGDILERSFFLAPCVGQDRVSCNIWEKVCELEGRPVDQSHGRFTMSFRVEFFDQ